MNNTHQGECHQFIEDFNGFVSLETYDEVSRNQSDFPLRTIQRTPILTNPNRVQSEQHYARGKGVDEHRHHPLPPNYPYDETYDTDRHEAAAAVTMMGLVQNRTLTPKAKRSRRSVSAPEIPQWDNISSINNYNDNNNDLLDLFDIDDNDQIRLATSNDGNAYQNHNNTANRAVRAQSHDDININSTLAYSNNTLSTSILPSVPITREGYPFFQYVDYSRNVDPTPVAPLTAVGRVPTFLAKLHAILLRPELQDIVRWLPHGRSWKVYDAPAFEKHVIAIYFEFTKHPNSSFFRQAKLWGFLRMKQSGLDQDSYYHPRFLRGLPHLCKEVRRPPASQLPEIPPTEQEPNLTIISEIHPVPPSSNAILVDPTIHIDWFMKGKQAPMKPSNIIQHPPPSKEVIAKKTSSSTSTSTDYSAHTVVKRKRAPLYRDTVPTDVTHHRQSEYQIEPMEVKYNNMNIDDDDDDEPPIDDDLGLNLDPFFSKGYHLYPFYDYIDYSNHIDMYPLQPYTENGQEPIFPILLHAMLLRQRHAQVTIPSLQWQTHGRAWKICSLTKLEEDIRPIFSRNCTSVRGNSNVLGSFFRDVTRWGFKRIDPSHGHLPNNSSDVGCYYHPKFLRGLPHLCKDWNMNDVPSTSSLSSSQTLSEVEDLNDFPDPDFTRISQLHPIPDYDPNMNAEDLIGFNCFL